MLLTTIGQVSGRKKTAELIIFTTAMFIEVITCSDCCYGAQNWERNSTKDRHWNSLPAMFAALGKGIKLK